MAQIKNQVSFQAYGDEELQNKLISSFRDSGFDIKLQGEKDYVTKKGEEGHYISFKLTLEEK